jgi:hypothetical protein
MPVCVVGTDSVTRPVNVNSVGAGVGVGEGVGCGEGAVGPVGRGFSLQLTTQTSVRMIANLENRARILPLQLSIRLTPLSDGRGTAIPGPGAQPNVTA